MQSYATTTPGFCPNCGSILPQLKATGGVECYLCSTSYSADGMSFDNNRKNRV